MSCQWPLFGGMIVRKAKNRIVLHVFAFQHASKTWKNIWAFSIFKACMVFPNFLQLKHVFFHWTFFCSLNTVKNYQFQHVMTDVDLKLWRGNVCIIPAPSSKHMLKNIWFKCQKYFNHTFGRFIACKLTTKTVSAKYFRENCSKLTKESIVNRCLVAAHTAQCVTQYPAIVLILTAFI